MLTDLAVDIQLFPWDKSITKRELVLRVCTANIISSKHSLWPLKTGSTRGISHEKDIQIFESEDLENISWALK